MTNGRLVTEGKSATVGMAACPPAQAAPSLPSEARTIPTVVDPTTIGYLVIRVLQDPVIRQAWREAANDCSRLNAVWTVDNAVRAAGAVAIAGSETAAAWRRHGGTTPLLRVSDATLNPAR